MVRFVLFACGIFFAMISCQNEGAEDIVLRNTAPPNYQMLHLELGTDTVRFALNDSTYNKVSSVATFSNDDRDFLSLHERRSNSICIYDVSSRRLIKQLFLPKLFKNIKTENLSVFCKNFDSIFLTIDRHAVYLIDTTGNVKQKAKLPDIAPDMIVFRTDKPLIVKNNILFAGFNPSRVRQKKSVLEDWKPIYGINMSDQKGTKYYHLPSIYRDHVLGFHFMHYSYCFNDRQRFVFSFPADPNLYETDLLDFQMAYYGKSRYQVEDITPVSEIALKNGEGGKEFHTRDAYGAIYFDPLNKRYLRYFRQKVADDSNYAVNRKQPKESIIIFNENFQIIGESPISNEVSFSALFFSSNGKAYVRVKPWDEQTLCFVELRYQEQTNHAVKLVNR